MRLPREFNFYLGLTILAYAYSALAWVTFSTGWWATLLTVPIAIGFTFLVGSPTAKHWRQR